MWEFFAKALKAPYKKLIFIACVGLMALGLYLDFKLKDKPMPTISVTAPNNGNQAFGNSAPVYQSQVNDYPPPQYTYKTITPEHQQSDSSYSTTIDLDVAYSIGAPAPTTTPKWITGILSCMPVPGQP